MLQVVFSVEAVSYNLKTHDHLGKLSQVPVYIYILLAIHIAWYTCYIRYIDIFFIILDINESIKIIK